MSRPDLDAEWLEPDGLGGFASGTVGGVRRRRYHATLLAATTPPTGRLILVKGFDAWIERVTGEQGGAPQPEYLTVQRYAPDVTTRDFEHLVAFAADPWPTWTYRLADGTEIEHQLFVPHDRAMVALGWRLAKAAPGLRLVLRPFLAGCDAHALHHENPELQHDAEVTSGQVHWRPYRSLPAVASAHNGGYLQAPVWYRGFQLDEERARGFDYLEDAASPGVLSWDLSSGDAVWLLAAEGVPGGGAELLGSDSPQDLYQRLRRDEAARRARFPTRLARAADAYLAHRGEGKTIIAGYPWFTDWGRDTFIALRGLCLATGRLDQAGAILLQWAGTVSQGMLPNRFVDQGDAPEFNSVDASLWYVVAVHETLGAFTAAGKRLPWKQRETLLAAVQAILQGYA